MDLSAELSALDKIIVLAVCSLHSGDVKTERPSITVEQPGNRDKTIPAKMKATWLLHTALQSKVYNAPTKLQPLGHVPSYDLWMLFCHPTSRTLVVILPTCHRMMYYPTRLPGEDDGLRNCPAPQNINAMKFLNKAKQISGYINCLAVADSLVYNSQLLIQVHRWASGALSQLGWI